MSYLFSWLRGGDLTIYYGVSYGSLDPAPKISNQPSVRSCLSMTPRVAIAASAGITCTGARHVSSYPPVSCLTVVSNNVNDFCHQLCPPQMRSSLTCQVERIACFPRLSLNSCKKKQNSTTSFVWTLWSRGFAHRTMNSLGNGNIKLERSSMPRKHYFIPQNRR